MDVGKRLGAKQNFTSEKSTAQISALIALIWNTIAAHIGFIAFATLKEGNLVGLALLMFPAVGIWPFSA